MTMIYQVWDDARDCGPPTDPDCFVSFGSMELAMQYARALANYLGERVDVACREIRSDLPAGELYAALLNGDGWAADDAGRIVAAMPAPGPRATVRPVLHCAGGVLSVELVSPPMSAADRDAAGWAAAIGPGQALRLVTEHDDGQGAEVRTVDGGELEP